MANRPMRAVTLCHPQLSLPRSRLWAYGYAELGALLDMTPEAVQKAVERGKFDPANLRDVVDFFLHRDQQNPVPYNRRRVA
jgi:hypothetical protein